LGITSRVPHAVIKTKTASPEESDHDIFDSDTIDYLTKANELDFRLYEYAKQLYANQLDALPI